MSVHPWRARVVTAAAVCGAVLVAASVITAALGHGFVLDAGPLRVSATRPVRLLREGLLAWLAAAALLGDVRSRGRAALVAAIVTAFGAALAAESTPRLVGDGAEYVAMARRVAAGQLPSVGPDEAQHLLDRLRTRDGYEGTELPAPRFRGTDGREDFLHFWLYPAVVAPVLAVIEAIGQPASLAFTIVNLALLAALAYALVRVLPPAAALVLAIGPTLWWIDKAHVETFTFIPLAVAFALHAVRPAVSLLLLGAVAAQNPGFNLVLLPMVAWHAWHGTRSRRPGVVAAACAALGMAALHPAYYLARLGRVTPLAGTIDVGLPGLVAVLTPLLDPAIGVVWTFPGLLVLLLVAARSGETATFRGWLPGVATILLAAPVLIALALPANANHGGTPGPSRYGVWMLPFLVLPLLGARPGGWREPLAAALAVLAMIHASWTFHPKRPENATTPNRFATWLSERAPALWSPLPEVFAERFSGVDGDARLPVASPECGKVLLAGEGLPRVRWPIPCLPSWVPETCTASGATCYANRRGDGQYAFASAPRQRSFSAGVDEELGWFDPRDLAWLPVDSNWTRLRPVGALSTASRIVAVEDVQHVRALQSDVALLALVVRLPTSRARVQVRAPASRTRAWWLDRRTRSARPIEPVKELQWIDVTDERGVLLIAETPAIDGAGKGTASSSGSARPGT